MGTESVSSSEPGVPDSGGWREESLFVFVVGLPVFVGMGLAIADAVLHISVLVGSVVGGVMVGAVVLLAFVLRERADAKRDGRFVSEMGSVRESMGVWWLTAVSSVFVLVALKKWFIAPWVALEGAEATFSFGMLTRVWSVGAGVSVWAAWSGTRWADVAGGELLGSWWVGLVGSVGACVVVFFV